ncbi:MULTISPECIES: hypothetical protein [unclassified Micromonospora]|uniref:hypothetical protein n=1 Tax=unclassified Micromonospora TaxID=2617518 RepID=UPI001034AED9|nr:hypothetical protein [Verrucosispora sp. SN26_14.1]TBL36953.1 hypothetical protein EYA84_11325 [Verrucosispora sp. SN26_14.1]
MTMPALHRSGVEIIRREVPWVPVVGAGGALGLFAFVGDELPGVWGLVILTLASSGFAWGMAALLAGYASTRHEVAPVNATVLLLLATVTYYGLILIAGRRWHLGQLADGSSAAASGLASVGRHTALWVVASVAAGVVLGCLGSIIRRGARLPASVAAGVALGLLAGQGLHDVLTFRAWGALDAFFLGRLIAAGMGVSLATVGVTLLFVRSRAARSWPVFVGTSLLISTAGVLLWSQIESIRQAL